LIGSGETAAITVPYVAIPPGMTADAEEPFSLTGSDPKTLLRPWHQALVHYAAALLEPLRKNFVGEQRQRQLFAALRRGLPAAQAAVAAAPDRHGPRLPAEASGRGAVSVNAQKDWRVWP
jgi:hypothetical protein